MKSIEEQQQLKQVWYLVNLGSILDLALVPILLDWKAMPAALVMYLQTIVFTYIYLMKYIKVVNEKKGTRFYPNMRLVQGYKK